jgi:hypothetical protein
MEQQFTALSLKKRIPFTDNTDNSSQKPVEEDAVMAESCRGSNPDVRDTVTTSNENVEQQHGDSEEAQLAKLKGMRCKVTTAIEDLFLQKLNETSTRKLRLIEDKMTGLRKGLVFFEGRIAET